MEDFVARQNVEHFRNELENGAVGPRRLTLLKRLVAEEELLGLTRQQFDEINHQIARIKAIVAQQIETVAMLKANGHSVDEAERRLANLTDLLIVYEARLQRIEAAI